MTLSTHVLDATSGGPATAVSLDLDRRTRHDWQDVGTGVTDDDGRYRNFSPDSVDSGVYRLVFDTGPCFPAAGLSGFYPKVAIAFEVTELHRHTTSHCCCPRSPTRPT
jgi:5-hydroxyisourate hydrolase